MNVLTAGRLVLLFSVIHMAIYFNIYVWPCEQKIKKGQGKLLSSLISFTTRPNI